MKELTEEEQIERAQKIKDLKMIPGWSIIEDIIRDMEEEAFDQFSELPIDAPQDKVLKCKSTKMVLKDLRTRIQQEIDLGKEAQLVLEQRKESEISEAMFHAQYDSSQEVNKLSKPLEWLKDLIKEAVPK
jgi:hypothetical protein